ncbi:TIGR02536 family ethanolamine utilization protein [Clostridium frigidicarnis]|uniref:Ethanolamine utilization protein n=1 Tax=Clostridium frigidicarnis TaxID=84698 RepID=A0A1I0ZW24_9CLOT|nr:TIGR02536 family ethanolamine utilization protein [Clostridium frigidicarnis]SFB28488.1 ethanolamine utilization protein [Clostridium frigidicarnis]
MNYDTLVDLIVKEVYKKLQETNNVNENKKTAVVFGGSDSTRYERVLGNEYDVVNYENNLEKCDVIIIEKLCLKGLGNLAALTGVSKSEAFIIKMLMEGKKVYVLEDGLEYRKYKSTSPKALYNRYIDFEKELIKYGIDIISSPCAISSNSVSNVISPNNVVTIKEEVEVENNSTFEIRNKKLITESDLRKPYMNGMKAVIIDKKSIITPLANDFVRIHHLKVKRV